ncbi:MAG: polysaccharide deacetylase family protein [Lysinibacillus sp.]|nr:polysaccharide deacetylase family protein [Lysinibacillus sp.]
MDNAIVFYFNQGEVAVKDVGSPTVTLPISYLNPILASVFQSEEKSEVTIVTPKENKKKVALTFDDGPHPKVTMQILNTLEKYDAKATFFMLGKQVEKHTDIAKEVVSRGHEIGNHTYNHPELTKQSTSQVQWQVDHTDQIIFDVIGEYPTVFRPPYGAKNQHVDSLIDVPVIMWTIDTYDWKHRDPNKLLPAVKANLHDGAIILMHDIHQSTADGLESVLIYLQQEGYEFVTVSELLAEQN